jgi:hypothetical protein
MERLKLFTSPWAITRPLRWPCRVDGLTSFFDDYLEKKRGQCVGHSRLSLWHGRANRHGYHGGCDVKWSMIYFLDTSTY